MGISVLNHHLEGEGETVLLLNGGFMTYGSWEPVAAHLRPLYRLLRCDLRGQLRSPGPSRPTLGANVGDVLDLLDSLDFDTVHVLGASFGAFVGLQLAAEHPDRIRSLIAATTTAVTIPDLVRGVKNLRRAIQDIGAGGDPGQFQDLLIEEVYSPEFVSSHAEEFAERRRQMSQLPRSWFADLEGILACTETVDLRPMLGRIRCPVLVIHAAADRVIPVQQSRALATALTAEFVEHPSSGHALIAEDPAWIADRCLRFLGRVSEQQPRVD